MLVPRATMAFVLALFCVCSQAQVQSQRITVTGQLNRAIAIGGESSGWTIHLDSDTTLDGKQVSSIEIDYSEIAILEKLAGKRVTATGSISHRPGVETGQRTIFVVSSMTTAKSKPQSPANTASFNLIGSEWLLEDLAGKGVIDNVQATLTFPEAGKVAGNGSCNRFFGPVEITGDAIKLGPLAYTRMACPEPVMNQEAKYMDALQKAVRFEWKAPHLLIYCKDLGEPLRFTRIQAPKPAAP